MIQALLLLTLLGLMHGARSFTPLPGLGSGPASVALAAGFLLLCALLAGDLFKLIGLPRLTGYLAAGMAVGPSVLGLVSDGMLVDLRVFNGVAIALIALTAGTEMDFKVMRPLVRSIGAISGIAVCGTMLVLAATAFLLRDLMPFTQGLNNTQMAALAAVLGVTLASQSPAVVVALRKEMEADGPVSRTVLGVVVAADLIVIVMFALVTGIARPLLGGGDHHQVSLAWEIFGSLGIGSAIGLAIILFLRQVSSGSPLLVVVMGFLMAEIGQRVSLDPLLIALCAGMVVRNLSPYGDRLHHDIEEASLPVYASFFAVSGAAIHLHALMTVGLTAAVFMIVRALSFLGGTRLAAHLARSPKGVGTYAGFGLLPQAGLALALALLFSRSFPQLGDQAAALVFGIVAMNELVAPVLYRRALIRCGEAGASATEEVASIPMAPAELVD